MAAFRKGKSGSGPQSADPVKYNPTKLPSLSIGCDSLSDLLYPEDIPTVQEFIGYCLIPSNKGQRMMVIKGRAAEGKSQIGCGIV